MSDPDKGGVGVGAWPFTGRRVRYTPNVDFTGVDTFAYRVSDGASDNATRTAYVTVFDAFRASAEQVGRDTDGDGVVNGSDAFPRNSRETVDTDGDGLGDNEEIAEGSDPHDPDDPPAGTGLPVWLLYEANRQMPGG